MAAIAGATLLPAACDKTRNTLEQPHHNTTYVWGKNNLTHVFPADKITKSVDSTLVDFVFLENDGESWEGWPSTIILAYINKILDDVKSDNKHKIRGAGTLNDVGLGNEQTYKDSVTLVQMGFRINRAR